MNTNTNMNIFSMISPKEWGVGDCQDTFLGAYYYDFDKKFVKQDY